MDSMVTPSAHGAGFATSGYSANFGPAWASYGASEAAIAGILYAGQGRTDNAVFSHFLRDSIERRSDVAELRAEIKELKNGDPEKEALKLEVQRLRDAGQASALAAILAAVTPKNGS